MVSLHPVTPQHPVEPADVALETSVDVLSVQTVADPSPARPQRAPGAVGARAAELGTRAAELGTRAAELGTRAAELSAALRARLSGRPGRYVAQGVVLAAVVGGTLIYADPGTSLSLSVDGHLRSLHSKAATVRDLLADEGVSVNDRDLVAPALDSTLSEGQQVVVRFARPLTVTVDGRKQTYWTTELTVDAALRSLNLRVDGAQLSVASRSASLGRDGLALTLGTPRTVTITVDGRTLLVTTTAATVADLLAEQQLTLGPLDTLSSPASTPLVSGLALTLARVTKRTVTVTESMPFAVTKNNDPTLPAGTRKTVTAGQPGVRVATYTITVTDGRQTGKVLVNAITLQAPVAGVVQVGTKPAASGGGSVGGNVDSLNWAALAKCESGGNPRAVNPAGYYGLYQFSLSTWRSVGGTGNPIDASPDEQTYRAKLLYAKGGAGQWGCGRHLFD